MRSLAATVLCVLLGCASSDVPAELPEPFTDATAMRDCAPWDEPAVSILLTTHTIDSTQQVELPYARLTVWRGLETLAGGVFVWPADEMLATGSWCDTENHCESAQSGMIEIHAVGDDSSITGDFELAFASGEPVAGGFQAVWLNRQVACG